MAAGGRLLLNAMPAVEGDGRTAWRRVARRWGALAAAVGAIAVFAVVDARLKASDVVGFAPPDADWIAVSDDFGAFWEGVEASDALGALLEAGPHPLRRVAFHGRRMTGIRPTPSRWNLWMGPRLAAWGRDGRVGFSARPGILLRLAHIFSLPSRTIVQGVPTFRYGALHYVWREGHLVAATTVEDVLAAAAIDPADVDPAMGAAELRLTVRLPEELRLRLSGEDGWPTSGWIALPLLGGGGALSLAALPEEPVAFVGAANGRDLAALLRLAARKLAEVERVESFARFAAALAGQWELPSLEALAVRAPGVHAVALVELDESMFPPLPVLAWLVRPEEPPRGLHPWAEFLPPGHALAFEWNNRPGVLAPWLSEKIALCLGQTDALWVAATREALMADIALTANGAERADADVLAYLDWDKAGRAAAVLLRQLAQLDLMHDDGVYPFREGRSRHAEQVRGLGALELRGDVRDGRLYFEGRLARLEAGP